MNLARCVFLKNNKSCQANIPCLSVQFRLTLTIICGNISDNWFTGGTVSQSTRKHSDGKKLESNK